MATSCHLAASAVTAVNNELRVWDWRLRGIDWRLTNYVEVDQSLQQVQHKGHGKHPSAFESEPVANGLRKQDPAGRKNHSRRHASPPQNNGGWRTYCFLQASSH